MTVHFARGVMIKSKKGEFLNSKAKKQHFIHYLSGKLGRAGCIIDHHANDDDDVDAHFPYSGCICQTQRLCSDRG